MTDKDICGATAKSTGEPCKRPAGWGTPNDSGRCKFHGGSTPTKDENPDVGAPEGNTNSVSHGIYAEINKTYTTIFTDEERELTDGIFEDYYNQYVERHGEPPLGHETKLFNISVNLAKEVHGDNWAAEKPDELHSGNALVDREKTIKVADGFTVDQIKYKKTVVLAAQKTLSNDTRQWLKDLGLLESSPDDRQAGALGDIKELWAQDLS